MYIIRSARSSRSSHFIQRYKINEGQNSCKIVYKGMSTSSDGNDFFNHRISSIGPHSNETNTSEQSEAWSEWVNDYSKPIFNDLLFEDQSDKSVSDLHSELFGKNYRIIPFIGLYLSSHFPVQLPIKLTLFFYDTPGLSESTHTNENAAIDELFVSARSYLDQRPHGMIFYESYSADVRTHSNNLTARQHDSSTLPSRVFDRRRSMVCCVRTASFSNQWLYDTLYRQPTSIHSLKTMVSALAAQFCLEDYRKRKKIDDFCLNYQSSLALQYYIRKMFFYQVINRVLRQQRYDLIYQFRHAIIDIMNCMRESPLSEPDTTSKILYRGQQMSVFEIEKLKNNIGEQVSSSSFLSTSTNLELAETFAGDGSYDDPLIVSVIMKIHFDSGQRMRPYTRIKNSTEEERLLLPGTKFVLMSCRKLHDNGRLWLLDLKAVSDEQHEQLKLNNGETFLLLSSASGWPVSVVVVYHLIT